MADNQDEEGMEMRPMGQGSIVEIDNGDHNDDIGTNGDNAETENTDNNDNDNYNAVNNNTQALGATLQQIDHDLEQGIQPGRVANAYPLSPVAQFFENLNYICMFVSAFGDAIWAWGFFPSLVAYPEKMLNIIATM